MRNVRLPASGPKKWAKNKRQCLVRPVEHSSLPPGSDLLSSPPVEVPAFLLALNVARAFKHSTLLAHTADPGTRVQRADGLVELSGGLAPGRWREYRSVPDSLSRRHLSVPGRDVPQ